MAYATKIDLADATHEEIVAEARRLSKRHNDTELAQMAEDLQTTIDAEMPSKNLARDMITHMRGY